MTTSITSATPVLVVGAGIMGAGIAQVAAQAGHPVRLFDAREAVAEQAVAGLATTLEGLARKGKLSADAVQATLARLRPVAALDEARDAGVVVEAIVEQLDVKRRLLKDLEAVVGDACILATNTSSISVTALANGMRRPERLVGMHFFNPVPLMKLVEVVSGLHTDPGVAQAVFDLGRAWGKVPVHARSTPGFIVNRIARPYYAETLALLQERAAEPPVLDACLKGAGFRMGPCELMDLIGHDTNFAVTMSVYEANFFDKRFVPSPVQRELVDGGLLGRKSGRGFYRHDGSASPPLPATAPAAPDGASRVAVHGAGAMADHLHRAAGRVLEGRPGTALVREADSEWVGLEVDSARLLLTDGRSAREAAQAMRLCDLVVFDRPLVLPVPGAPAPALAFACAGAATDRWRRLAPAWLSALGFAPMPMADAPGLVVARTVAMLINEAADAVQQGVCSEDGADAAMKLGVNYPAGPFEWLSGWGVSGVVAVLDALDAHYRGERYRVSPWLRARWTER